MTSRAPALAVIAIVGAIATFAGATPSNAQGAETGISVLIDSPPSITESLTARLLLDGTDITDSACTPFTDPDTPVPGIQCDGLDDGVYSVEVVGVPADAIERWSCADITASPTEPTSITIGGGFTDWSCGVTVSAPGVIIVPTSSFGFNGREPSFELEVRDDAGTVVSDGCEPDSRGGDGTRLWCVPLAPGTYEATPLGVPDGYLAAAFCAAAGSGAFPSFSTFEISDATPLWSCEEATAFRPLIVNFTWNGAEGRDRAWFDALEFTLTDGDNNDVTDQCEEEARSDNSTDLFVEWACSNTAGGTYTASFADVPADYAINTDCAPIAVPDILIEPVFCVHQVTSEPLVVPSTEPTGPDQEPPSPVLPETGTASGRAAALGLLATAFGAALVLSTRRRPKISR